MKNLINRFLRLPDNIEAKQKFFSKEFDWKDFFQTTRSLYSYNDKEFYLILNGLADNVPLEKWVDINLLRKEVNNSFGGNYKMAMQYAWCMEHEILRKQFSPTEKGELLYIGWQAYDYRLAHCATLEPYHFISGDNDILIKEGHRNFAVSKQSFKGTSHINWLTTKFLPHFPISEQIQCLLYSTMDTFTF